MRLAAFGPRDCMAELAISDAGGSPPSKKPLFLTTMSSAIAKGMRAMQQAAGFFAFAPVLLFEILNENGRG
ncbi:MAG: hypothetical protein COA80_06915 [Leeuwenhoekiella sp.]|nr:MAG: hypothetical protein COA80_06915 [Leeuwenhoekiella sp.]